MPPSTLKPRSENGTSYLLNSEETEKAKTRETEADKLINTKHLDTEYDKTDEYTNILSHTYGYETYTTISDRGSN